VERYIATDSDNESNGHDEEKAIINAVPINSIPANSNPLTKNSHATDTPGSTVIILD